MGRICMYSNCRRVYLPILLLMLVFSLSAESSVLPPFLHPEDRAEMEEFFKTATDADILERMNIDDPYFYQDRQTKVEDFLLEELARRNTQEARECIQKIYITYVENPSIHEERSNSLAARSAVIYADLVSEGNEKERMQGYEDLMRIDLHWQVKSEIGRRLGENKSREAWDFINKHQWNAFRYQRNIDLFPALTIAERWNFVRQTIYDNPKKISDIWGAEYIYFSRLGEYDLYYHVKIQKEYDALLNSPEPHSAEVKAYIDVLDKALDSIQRQQDSFSVVEMPAMYILLKNNDLEEILEWAHSYYKIYDNSEMKNEELKKITESVQIFSQIRDKANIYKCYLYAKMESLTLSKEEQVAYLLAHDALYGIRIFEDDPGVKPSNPFEENKDYGNLTLWENNLGHRLTSMLMEYDENILLPQLEKALSEANAEPENNVERLVFLNSLNERIAKRTEARSRFIEWGVLNEDGTITDGFYLDNIRAPYTPPIPYQMEEAPKESHRVQLIFLAVVFLALLGAWRVRVRREGT